MTFQIIIDYEAFGSTGSTFQVVQLIAENGTDYSFLISSEIPYFNLDEVRADIAAKLDVDCDEIDLEQV